MKSTFFSSCLVLLLAATASVTATSSAGHARRRHHSRKLSSAAAAAAEALNKPTDGTPVSDFAADPALPAAKLAAAALKLKKGSMTYPVDPGSKVHSTIYTDWNTGKNGSAIVFTADMDVDCDGIDYKCKGNPDGQDQTDYGALAAYEAPFMVIPESFVNKNEKLLPGNNVVAVICGGKMFYAIFGDTNGDSPEVIGEASWRMAQACFPTENLNGNNGHVPADVTYIVFTGADAVLPKDAMTTSYITQFSTLKSMGDAFVGALAANIGLSGGGAPAAPPPKSASTSKAAGAAAPTAPAKGTGNAAIGSGANGGKKNPAKSCSSKD